MLLRKFHVVVAATALSAALLVASSPAHADGPRLRDVEAQDRCEPVTFNAAIPDVCAPSRHGNVTFDRFLDRLNPKDGGHGAWRFSATHVSVKSGDQIRVTNTGGEFHTFTEVPEFGGGCVTDLNDPLGLPLFEGDCGAAFANVIPPGASLTVSPMSAGEHRFICVIHPWMRSTVSVRA
jgi:plastocyanin